MAGRGALTLELELMPRNSGALDLCPALPSAPCPPPSVNSSFQGDSRSCSSTDMTWPSVVNMYLVPDLWTGFSSSNSWLGRGSEKEMHRIRMEFLGQQAAEQEGPTRP